MNDRELLELAAKAAGQELKYDTFGQSENADRVYCYWNPLTDDADALRLAVKLEIDLSFYTEHDAKVYAQTKHLLGYGTDGRPSYQAHEYHKELYKDSDPYAATRRAIVRAAAQLTSASNEIGKAMK